MKRIISLITILATALTLASCSIVSRSTFGADTTQLNLRMDDLQFLGETQISVEYNTYLGIFTRVDKVNGEVYDRKVHNFTYLHTNTILARKLNIAAHKAIEDFPEANYFIVTNQRTTKDVLFLGSAKTVCATVKAYKIK